MTVRSLPNSHATSPRPTTEAGTTVARVGVLYILVSGACFGLLPWFARVAYSHGADPFGMLAARFTMAGIILCVVRTTRMRRSPWPSRPVLTRLFLLGAVGYAPQATFFFNGVKRIDTSLATVIFYTYPVLVVLASWLVFRHRPSRTTSMCLAVAVVGAVLTAGQVGAGSVTGVVFMFAAACWYTGYILASSRVVQKVDSLTSITVVMFGAAAAHLLILAVTDSHLPADGRGWWAALGAAFFSTVIAMGFFFAGVRIVGPGEAAVLSTIEPVVSIIVGVTALHESLGIVRIGGAAMVLVSVAVLARSSGSAGADAGQRYSER
ncbi:MAG: hypothetical protein RJA47_1488 [Actinomycetota bacterium]